jgi:hypothetical protein
MLDQSPSLILRADSLIQSNQLKPKAKAFLLLKLCQVNLLFSQEKAAQYWNQLAPLKNQLPEEEKAHLPELAVVFEEGKIPGGFAGKMIEDIKAKCSQPELLILELRDFLLKCEEETEKKFLLKGKQAIWMEIVSAWKNIDRKKALPLTAKLSPKNRESMIRRMHHETPLTVEEWHSFLATNSQPEAVRIITVILDEEQPKLSVPNTLIIPITNAITSKFTHVNQLNDIINKVEKFLGSLMTVSDNLQYVFEALKTCVDFLASTNVLTNNWVDRFDAILRLIVWGVVIGLINENTTTLFVKNIPDHLREFSLTTSYGMLANEENAERYLTSIKSEVKSKQDTETWFLILLGERGLAELAYALAAKSPNALEVLPYIYRALLRSDQKPAMEKIPASAIAGDPVAQIRLRSAGQERADYLREVTHQGQGWVPGALWAQKKPEEEKKGFWDSMFKSGKTIDQIVDEYLARNPLYSSFKVNTPPQNQFSEFIRNRNEYRFRVIDPILLEALSAWGDSYPNEVKQCLHTMWGAIQPDMDLLKIDFIRNAIFNRCTTVFAADADILVRDFLTWLKTSLIDKSLSWQWGRTQYTVHYPPTALASMCIQSAIAVQEISPIRRDQLVKTALVNYQSDDGIAELGARLYNTGKAALDLELPWNTKSKVQDGWQLGIVKNAIPVIFQEIVQAAQPVT